MSLGLSEKCEASTHIPTLSIELIKELSTAFWYTSSLEEWLSNPNSAFEVIALSRSDERVLGFCSSSSQLSTKLIIVAEYGTFDSSSILRAGGQTTALS